VGSNPSTPAALRTGLRRSCRGALGHHGGSEQGRPRAQFASGRRSFLDEFRLVRFFWGGSQCRFASHSGTHASFCVVPSLRMRGGHCMRTRYNAIQSRSRETEPPRIGTNLHDAMARLLSLRVPSCASTERKAGSCSAKVVPLVEGTSTRVPPLRSANSRAMARP